MPRRALRRSALGSLALLLALGASISTPGIRVASQTAGAEVLQVCPACPIQTIPEALERAAEGQTIEVIGGTHAGGLVIEKSVALVGVDRPVIDGGGAGTVVRIAAPGVRFEGFVVRGTGSSHDKEDSGIIVDAPDAVIADNHLEDVLFGIYLRQADRTAITGNVVLARPVDQARRGDGIRVWYSNDVLIEDNVARDGRDMILWYSDGAVIRGNDFDRNRYGMHLMFSNHTLIEGNSFDGNTVGLYVMYSRDVHVIGNSLSNNAGASGGGLGLKDVDLAIVEANRIVNNQTGVQIDTSPREPNIENLFLDNVFAFNDIGIAVQPAVRHNTFTGNAFIDNTEHVGILGRGQLRDLTWAVDGRGNYWSDYAGYDADRDGIGDLPYRSQQLFESMVADDPALRLFLYSPAALAIDFSARAFPEFRPQVKFEDPAPLMRAQAAPQLPPAETGSARTRVALGLGATMTTVVGLAAVAGIRRRPIQTLQVQEGMRA